MSNHIDDDHINSASLDASGDSAPVSMPLSQPTASPMSRARAERLFLEHLPTIRRLLASTAHRHSIRYEDAEEFAAMAQLRLISDDYAAIRKFRSQCPLRAFLAVVIERMYLDFRVAQWGKWRPKASTRRRGDVAVLFERLTMRDGYTLDEACSMLEINHRLRLDRDAIERMHARFGGRVRPRLVTEEALREMPAADAWPDQGLVSAERRLALARVTARLARAVAALEPRDRLILKLRYVDGRRVTDIARVLKLDAKRLFRHLDRVFATLRSQLEKTGVCASDLLAALEPQLRVDVPSRAA